MSSIRRICALAALALGLGAAEQCRADLVYLALGDSLTFGIDPSTPAAMAPSYGDQGFVSLLADYLGSKDGGVRPDVLNLAIPGEAAVSFSTATPPPGWLLRLPELNLNYPDATTPQHDLMVSSIASIHAAGDSVGYISFLVGSNDIFALVQSPDFLAAPPDAQLAMIAATIGTTMATYQAVLTELATLAPEATVLLPGYYNPFPGFAPEHGFYDAILGIFNPAVEATAGQFGARYVDLYPLVAGRELELTNIASGDVHPNQAGYSVLADAFTQAVPEPSCVALLASGSPVLLIIARRRRRAPARV